MVHSLVTFLALSALVIMTPGPDTALTIRNTLLGGRRQGLATALGVAFGQAIWTTAASAGVTALLLAWGPAYRVFQLAGAAYLVLLGVQSLVLAVRGRAAAAPGRSPAARAGGDGLRQGVLSNLANPKMAVFFTSLLPQFAPGAGPGGHPTFAALALLGLVFCTMTLTWLSLYAIVIARLGRTLDRGGLRRALDGLMGTALVALGVRLAAERR